MRAHNSIVSDRGKTAVGLSLNNLSAFADYGRALSLAYAGARPPYVEILWDNYSHLSPTQLRAAVAPFGDRIALHVMWSRFIEAPEHELHRFLDILSRTTKALSPLYVSDHLCRFAADGRHSIIPLEWQGQRGRLRDRVSRYQDAIRQPLLLENYASTDATGGNQVALFDWLVQKTGCGILFDVSNACVAEKNHVLPAANWIAWLSGRRVNCHIGGYSWSRKSRKFHDSHATPVSRMSLRVLQQLCAQCEVSTITYEADYSWTVDRLVSDLQRVALATSASTQPG